MARTYVRLSRWSSRSRSRRQQWRATYPSQKGSARMSLATNSMARSFSKRRRSAATVAPASTCHSKRHRDPDLGRRPADHRKGGPRRSVPDPRRARRRRRRHDARPGTRHHPHHYPAAAVAVDGGRPGRNARHRLSRYPIDPQHARARPGSAPRRTRAHAAGAGTWSRPRPLPEHGRTDDRASSTPLPSSSEPTRSSSPRRRSGSSPPTGRRRSCPGNHAGRAARTPIPRRRALQPAFQDGHLRALSWRSDAEHGQPGAFDVFRRQPAARSSVHQHGCDDRQRTQQSDPDVGHQRRDQSRR